jgi:hypothetical protein
VWNAEQSQARCSGDISCELKSTICAAIVLHDHVPLRQHHVAIMRSLNFALNTQAKRERRTSCEVRKIGKMIMLIRLN